MTSRLADPAADLPEPPSGHRPMATPGRTDMTAFASEFTRLQA
jgi:hypothetical protein